MVGEPLAELVAVLLAQAGLPAELPGTVLVHIGDQKLSIHHEQHKSALMLRRISAPGKTFPAGPLRAAISQLR